MPSYSRTVHIPGKTSQELYDTVSAEIGRLISKYSLGNYGITRNPEKKEVSLKSSIFSATLFCDEGVLRLDGQLSFMAVPFRTKIDEGINRWLEKTFNISVRS
ncbi:MAG: hypothetical protein A2428_00035 [Bdellovibrionales bacterium RIFOXYC1_FULL_54_43]|nr:MAG: hypothetical protein A2428_00035 [Bdellovibrionales bacterium RIFOXYC1_FULL_54_43]OFZ81826.1 MAG: hypothetical protein A2603_06585 [Bdellovibrionales bacterium RIFOXYD1_FULL_55_31]